ncbi:unnamed protein product [Haemonchus placei]|uniref:L-serine deaminase n=1 Tax=Haemonchus placei TaxID=6290 RepID=A0A0N4W5Z4_HAEPC|nr:unnamed protein product [Haemonchus placei]
MAQKCRDLRLEPSDRLAPAPLSAFLRFPVEKNAVVRTKCQHSRFLSNAAGCDVFLKLENTQITGSFKERSACNALLCLSEEERKKGVYVGSTGNFARAVSFHGEKLGVPVTVVLPRFSSLSTIAACKSYRANVVIEGKTEDDPLETAFKLARECGGKFINSHDHLDVMAGAGTAALEILQDIKDIDAILVPVGGGGLLAATTVAVKNISPDTKVIGLESETCPATQVRLRPVDNSRLPNTT